MPKGVLLLEKESTVNEAENSLFLDFIEREFGLVEIDVEILIAKDEKPINIAKEKEILLKVVEQHVTNIFIRLDVSNLKRAKKIFRRKIRESTLTVKEITDLFNVHRKTIIKWADNGFLSAVRIYPWGERMFPIDKLPFTLGKSLKESYQANQNPQKPVERKRRPTLSRLMNEFGIEKTKSMIIGSFNSDSISEKEKQILSLRLGLKDGKSHTLKEIGEQFGITKEAIGAMESRAFYKMQHPLILSWLVFFPSRIKPKKIKPKREEKKLLKVREVAEIFKVRCNTVRKWSNKGLLHPIRIGEREDRRFYPDEVSSLKEKRGVN